MLSSHIDKKNKQVPLFLWNPKMLISPSKTMYIPMSLSNSMFLQCMLGVKISHHLGKRKSLCSSGSFWQIWESKAVLTQLTLQADVRKNVFNIINSSAAAWSQSQLSTLKHIQTHRSAAGNPQSIKLCELYGVLTVIKHDRTAVLALFAFMQ